MSPCPGNRFDVGKESDGAVEAGVEDVDSLPSVLGSKGAASGALPGPGMAINDSGELGGDLDRAAQAVPLLEAK